MNLIRWIRLPYSLRLFFQIVKYKFLARIEYPGSFAAGIVTQWIAYGVEMLILFLMVWNFGSLVGWLPAEIIFMYAAWLLSYAIGASFVFNIVINLHRMAIDGAMDEALTRPMRPLAYLIAAHYNLGYISHVLITVAALAWSIGQLGLAQYWTALHWLWLVIMIIAGAVINGCMMLICEMPALRLRSQSPVRALFWESWTMMRYPITIYPRPLQFVFTVVLPYGFVSFYPMQVLLGRTDGLLPGVTMWLSPFVAILLIGITGICWRKVSAGYESAGT